MRFAKHHHRKPLEINMTPMIDVVFLLLIFFMTCTQVSEINREPLELPRLAGTHDQTRAEVAVNIDREGVIRVSGETCTVATLIVLCGEEAARSHGGDATKLAIVLRVDRRADCRRVNEVVAALTKLQITKVRLAVTSE